MGNRRAKLVASCIAIIGGLHTEPPVILLKYIRLVLVHSLAPGFSTDGAAGFISGLFRHPASLHVWTESKEKNKIKKKQAGLLPHVQVCNETAHPTADISSPMPLVLLCVLCHYYFMYRFAQYGETGRSYDNDHDSKYLHSLHRRSEITRQLQLKSLLTDQAMLFGLPSRVEPSISARRSEIYLP